MSVGGSEGLRTAVSHRENVKVHGVDPTELRKRRVDECTDVNKKLRHEAVNGSRLLDSQNVGCSFKSLRAMAEACRSPKRELCLLGATGIRKLLHAEATSHDALIETGILPSITQFLTSDSSDLQMEAALILADVTRGSSKTIELIVAPSVLIYCLSIDTPEFLEQIVLALGNIAGDSNYSRNMVVREGIMHPLLRIISVDFRFPVLIKNVTWALANIFRYHDPAPEFEAVEGALLQLHTLLVFPDFTVQIEALWCVYFAVRCGKKFLKVLIKTGVLHLVVPFANCTDIDFASPAMGIFGHVVCSDQYPKAVKEGAIETFLHWLNSGEKALQQEAARGFRNLCTHISQLVDLEKSGAIRALCRKCTSEMEFTIRKECCIAICNAIACRSKEIIASIVSAEGVLDSMRALLKCGDEELVCLLLGGLNNLLIYNHVEEQEGHIPALEEADVADSISDLLKERPPKSIAALAQDLLERFFAEDGMTVETPTSTCFCFTPPTCSPFPNPRPSTS
ncbi:importin subunit alpha-3 [Pelomyxa schiedti]|nr:importin subunit alpha-3 [Pelomyxa schiedti]